MPFQNKLPYGKFKKLLIMEDFLLQESIQLQKEIMELENQFLGKEKTDSEICIEFLKIFLHSRFKILQKKINPESLLNPRKRIYGLPFSVQYTLKHWAEFSFNLQLINYNPSAFEMARLQSQGSRFITIDFEAAKKGELIENKRDSFEHCLHDLAHAYMFFKEDDNRKKQILFFQNLIQNYSIFEKIMREDSEFETKFTYCLSDMNSHPEHLKSYLRAILIEVYLKIEDTISTYRRNWIEEIVQEKSELAI